MKCMYVCMYVYMFQMVFFVLWRHGHCTSYSKNTIKNCLQFVGFNKNKIKNRSVSVQNVIWRAYVSVKKSNVEIWVIAHKSWLWQRSESNKVYAYTHTALHTHQVHGHTHTALQFTLASLSSSPVSAPKSITRWCVCAITLTCSMERVHTQSDVSFKSTVAMCHARTAYPHFPLILVVSKNDFSKTFNHSKPLD